MNVVFFPFLQAESSNGEVEQATILNMQPD